MPTTSPPTVPKVQPPLLPPTLASLSGTPLPLPWAPDMWLAWLHGVPPLSASPALSSGVTLVMTPLLPLPGPWFESWSATGRSMQCTATPSLAKCSAIIRSMPSTQPNSLSSCSLSSWQAASWPAMCCRCCCVVSRCRARRSGMARKRGCPSSDSTGDRMRAAVRIGADKSAGSSTAMEAGLRRLLASATWEANQGSRWFVPTTWIVPPHRPAGPWDAWMRQRCGRATSRQP
ncbi:hypothetical protein V8C86DRAFT_2519026 [Haematococcus lacustris]